MRVDCLNKQQQKAIENRLSGDLLLIWQIGCSTGLRISDILDLKISQITKEYSFVKEKKTGKTRRVYFKKGIRKKAEEYATKNKLNECDKAFNVTRQTVWNNIKKAAKLENIETNVGTHSMRKSYSIAYINKGYSIEDLHKRLNHTNMADTIGYITTNKQLGLDIKGRKTKKRGKISC